MLNCLARNLMCFVLNSKAFNILCRQNRVLQYHYFKKIMFLCKFTSNFFFVGSREHSSYSLLFQEWSEVWYSIHSWGEWVQRQGSVPSRCDKERTNEHQLLLSCLEWGGGSRGIPTSTGGRRGTQSQSNKGKEREGGKERGRERERERKGSLRLTVDSRGDTVLVLSII